ncbi:MAG TPA: hypothetical protein VGI46_07640 [Candidatus Acidoferrum sp.]|jgi:hypothetical protein
MARKNKRTNEQIATELASLAVEHLKDLPPLAREARIAEFGRRVSKSRQADAPVSGTRDFFWSPTLEQLAEAQGVTSLKSPNDLAGGWPAEESIDDFLDLTRRTRR